MNVRLLFINRYFYPDISATAQLLTELAEDLAAQGDTMTIITGTMAYAGDKSVLPAQEFYKGIRIVRVGSTCFGRTRTLGRLVDCVSFWISAFVVAIRTKHQDCLIVLSDPPLLSVLAAVVRAVKRVKTVCWLQDVFPEIAVRAGVLPEGFLARWIRRLGRWSLWQMDQVIVIGGCMERFLLSQGLPARLVIRIPNWADGRLIQPLPKENNAFFLKHGLQDRFVVMYSGNHGMVHEFETLVALIRKTQSTPRICFCFVGEGAWKPRLVDISQAEGWPHVVFLPYQPKDQLECSLSAAEMHLVSLRAEMEGLCVPSKLYGVLAAGRPVLFVGPAESEVARVIREAGCGASVMPGDTAAAVEALLTLYRDKALRERQGKAARDYFERYCDRSFSTQRFRQVLQRVTVHSSTRPMPLKTVSPPTWSQ